MASKPTIREFYRGRSVLVTGGTGFMGKVLIEKLLYTVPDIGKIYVVMRSKKGKSVKQRLEEIQRSPAFDRLKSLRPNDCNKVVAIQGDVLYEDLGISSKDLNILAEEVSVVFHFAATLRLEAPLKDCIVMNTTGTQRALNVAKRLKNLAIFVHLSTAFCYPDYKVLEEKFHCPPADPQDVIRLCEWLDDKQLVMLTKSLLNQHPNCYTYSKRLAENLVNDAYAHMPTVIARPSIVCPSHTDPVPGWVDNLNGPVGLMLAAGKGVIRTMLCDGTLHAQVIPVDIAINAIIALGMIEGSKTTKSEFIPIYNLNTGDQSPTTWGEVLEIAKDYGRKYPLAWPLWYPNGDITTNYVAHEIKRIFYHMVPAYFIDFLLLICGQKRIMLRIQERINQGLDVLQYFTMREWSFPCPNYNAIHNQLNKEEQEIYITQVAHYDKTEYMHTAVEGGRVYCLKEDPSKMTLNRSYHNFLFVLDLLFKILFWCLILSFLASWFKPVRDVFSYGEPVVKHVPFLGSAVFNKQ